HYTATRDMLQAAAADFFATLQTGAVHIAKPAVYPLEDAVTAHKDLEARKTTGSVILRPSS
ncbi:MAG: zinc-binding dehydrogenase, partial [Pseudomonadota bacterium]